MLRPEHTHENSLWVHEFISSLGCELINLLAYPKSVVEKMFSFCQRKKINTRKSNQELINSKEYQLKSPPTQNLKLLFFLLQNHSNFRSVLAKISVKKQVKSRFFYPFTPWGLSVFKPRTCILHHLAFLVWLPTHYFLRPTTHF